jgi:hypothetical protein
VEGGPGRGLIALGALLAAVVQPGERASHDREGDQVLGVRHHHAPPVDDVRRDEDQGTAVRGKHRAVGGEAHGVGFAGHTQHVGGDDLAPAAGDRLQLARLVRHFPRQMELARAAVRAGAAAGAGPVGEGLVVANRHNLTVSHSRPSRVR